MDIGSLIRDPSKVHASLVELSNGSVVTKKPCKIYTPARFSEHGLAVISGEISICGIFAIVVEDKYYGISLANAMMQIQPTSLIKVKINGDEYYEFSFDAGATVIVSTQLLKTDTLVYKIYNEILAKGHIPWFIGYAESSKLFDSANYHAGADLGGNHEVIELVASMVTRDATDRNLYYRQTVKTLADVEKKKYVFIPLKDISYGATNTLTKLGGSYFRTGVVSALVSPATRTEKIEGILRK